MVHRASYTYNARQQGEGRGVGPHVNYLKEVVVGLTIKKYLGLENNPVMEQGNPTIPAAMVPSAYPMPQSDCMIENSPSLIPSKWKKLAHQVGNPSTDSDPMHIDRRPTLDVNEVFGG